VGTGGSLSLSLALSAGGIGRQLDGDPYVVSCPHLTIPAGFASLRRSGVGRRGALRSLPGNPPIVISTAIGPAGPGGAVILCLRHRTEYEDESSYQRGEFI